MLVHRISFLKLVDPGEERPLRPDIGAQVLEYPR